MAYLRSNMGIDTQKIRPVSVGSRQANAVALDAFSEGINHQSWMDEGACVGSGVNFFPTRGEATHPIKVLCQSCPVKEECLSYGLMQKHGIWGGLSERQRRQVRRDRGIVIDDQVRQPVRCVFCGDEFVPTSNSAKLCSSVCRAGRERVNTAARNRKARAQAS